MDDTTRIKARIGMVNYLNVAPIHERWNQSVTRTDWVLVEAPPATLNTKLYRGEIDLGFVSSYEYGAHPNQYQILSGLSISANGPVGSVFLFSHVPLEQLDGEPILLSAESETSINLLKIILEEFHKVQPVYFSGDVTHGGGDYRAILAIGDDALRLLESAPHLYQFDLGDIWKRKTGLPFVFAVCAVAESFCSDNGPQLVEIHRELLRCRDEGKEDLESICTLSASRIPMDREKCFSYLSAIEYDLGAEKRKALETFFEYLIARKDIPANALPLKIFTRLYE